jgi:hypothetical protein
MYRFPPYIRKRCVTPAEAATQILALMVYVTITLATIILQIEINNGVFDGFLAALALCGCFVALRQRGRLRAPVVKDRASPLDNRGVRRFDDA